MSPQRALRMMLLALGVVVPGLCMAQQAPEPNWAWRVADRPRIDLGGADADSNTSFSRVVAAFRLRDGRIAIAEFNSPPTIRYFTAAGRYLMQVGRTGGGTAPPSGGVAPAA